MAKPRVLYLYMGRLRKEMLLAVEAGTEPDSQFRGYRQLRERDDMHVEFVDLYDGLPRLIRWLPFQLRPIWHIRHVLSFDYVIASDALLLACITSMLDRFRRKSTKWVFLPINTGVLLSRHRKHKVRLMILRYALRHMWRIAYLSSEQKRILERVGIPPKRMRYVPLGIDLDHFNDATRTPPGDYVLSVGRDLGRDYATLFDAAKQVPYPFVVATSPKNIPTGLSAPSNMRILYDIPLAEVKKLYQHARLTCIVLQGEDTTEGSDCTGQTVMLEALATRQPVIASERAWIREYFKPEEEYLPVPVEDSAALADSIDRAWNDTGLLDRLGAHGYAKAYQRYRTEIMAAALVDILLEDI